MKKNFKNYKANSKAQKVKIKSTELKSDNSKTNLNKPSRKSVFSTRKAVLDIDPTPPLVFKRQNSSQPSLANPSTTDLTSLLPANAHSLSTRKSQLYLQQAEARVV